VAGRLRIGTSGYQYDHWRRLFYPEGLPPRLWFTHYAATFDTVELNSTFYRLPGRHVFRAWHDAAPPGFLYAVKYSRFATHMKKLTDPEQPLGRFLPLAGELAEHLGPILVQLPTGWRANLPRLAAFLEAAPRDYRWAIEVRDDTWLGPELYRLLERAGAALVIHDALPRHPRVVTAPFTYRRYHHGFTGSYSHPFLRREAERLQHELDASLDVYAYFNNDLGGHAVKNALTLRRYLQAGGDRDAPPGPAPAL
jgi:uncharacterized protein YecE (DUF72 family)